VDDLGEVAPAFVEMAHRIVWCSVATVDPDGRPWSRILHPLWQWDGTELVGWIASSPTPLKQRHLANRPFLSCSYWEPTHDTCSAACHAEWVSPDERAQVWQAFVDAPAPVGYDPAIVPAWKDGPDSDGFAALRLRPWRVRVMPGISMLTGGSQTLTWRERDA
jgi:hypothetical protein